VEGRGKDWRFDPPWNLEVVSSLEKLGSHYFPWIQIMITSHIFVLHDVPLLLLFIVHLIYIEYINWLK